MIQEYFKNELAAAYPFLKWSIDHYESKEDVGVVYAESSGEPSSYENQFRFPNYMILVRDRNWQRAEETALEILERFNRRLKEQFMTSTGRMYDIVFIEATSGVNRLGVDGKHMEYTINFKATIRGIIE